jgi:hypothetical protein
MSSAGGLLAAEEARTGTYFRFLQNVQDSCGLNLCLLGFVGVGCCGCGASACRPCSGVEVGVEACMVEETMRPLRPSERMCVRWRIIQIRDGRKMDASDKAEEA